MKLPYRCFQCHKRVKAGDLAIIINDFAVYHPDCYKKEREQVFGNRAILRQSYLADATARNDNFVATANSDSIKDTKLFYESWGKQLMVIELLSVVISDAQRIDAIGLLQQFQIRRKLRRAYNFTIDIGTQYRDDFGVIKNQIKYRELYPLVQLSPSTETPSMNQLKEEEQRALKNLLDNISELCNGNKLLLNEAKDISKRTIEAERKELREQIKRIDKDTRRLN